MARIGRHLKTEIDKYIEQVVETRLNYNQSAMTYAASGDDSPPLENDRIVLVQVDGTGRFVAVGVLTASQGAKPGEKILFSRDEDGEVKSVLRLLNDGKIEMVAPDAFSIESKKKLSLKSDDEFSLESAKKMAFKTDDAMDIDAGSGIKMAGGGKQAARKDDVVEVEIPAGAVIVAVSGGALAPAVGTPNPAPIKCVGKIVAGSGKVEIGG